MGDLYGKGPRGKATRLHAQIVRMRGACENVRTATHSDKLECAHIVSRRYASTRTDLDNALCLCSACHRHFTEWPLEFASFVIDRIGQDAYNSLRRKAQEIKKVDWVEEAARLSELWKQVEADA